MRHVREDDLTRLSALMALVRAFPTIRERTPGVFYRGGKAFLHFHEDGGELFADVRLCGAEFERVRVSAPPEQRALGRRIAAALDTTV